MAEYFLHHRLGASRSLWLALLISFAAHAALFITLNYGQLRFKSPNNASQEKSSRLELTFRQAIEDKSDQQREQHTNTQVPLSSAEAVTASSSPKPLLQASTSEAPVPAGLEIDQLYYYTLQEVEVRPYLQEPPVLKEAPSGALVAVNGTARLELMIENDGHVNSVELVSSDLPESYLSSLLAAFSKVRYTPAIKQGHQVRSRLTIEVSYVDGIVNHLPVVLKPPSFPSAPEPHVPITLPSDWHKRKTNPPLEHH